MTPGTRVRLLSASHVLTLRSHLGTIEGPADYDDYFLVRLDEPAIDKRDGSDLAVIVEMRDNMELLFQGD